MLYIVFPDRPTYPPTQPVHCSALSLSTTPWLSMPAEQATGLARLSSERWQPPATQPAQFVLGVETGMDASMCC